MLFLFYINTEGFCRINVKVKKPFKKINIWSQDVNIQNRNTSKYENTTSDRSPLFCNSFYRFKYPQKTKTSLTAKKKNLN